MEGQEITAEERALLEGTFLFRKLPAECLDWVLRDTACTRESFRRGEVIYRPDAFRRSLGVVLTGAVRVTKGDLIVSTLTAGELFGAAALFHERPDYESTLTAQTGCSALFFSQELVRELLRHWPQAGENYIHYLSDRIHFLSGRLDSLLAPTALQKVVRYLLNGAEECGTVEGSATELARRLDVGRASLYRAFDTLERAGAVTRTGKTLHIVDRRVLERFSKP